ncbi:hypothetical protein [Candidatus Magnetomonas plexicatena]|uniref:hypothetical protein n=1 Tax=Candidatus Magnetomonas plexicatena TaxID=2552947 RepID=UPI001102C475|nr:hypothetical protein E2O03_004265 [Nitrospirales bacterium LBB_01]
MAVKAVEIIRNIRDKYYEETKSFSVEEQIRFIRGKSEKLQRDLLKIKGTATILISDKLEGLR